MLMIMTDQHRPDHLGFGGNDIVQTPDGVSHVVTAVKYENGLQGYYLLHNGTLRPTTSDRATSSKRISPSFSGVGSPSGVIQVPTV